MDIRQHETRLQRNDGAHMCTEQKSGSKGGGRRVYRSSTRWFLSRFADVHMANDIAENITQCNDSQ